jgi:hypothetical protein
MIEFWVSPVLSTINDHDERYFIDIFSSERRAVTSSSSSTITLPNSAFKIENIKLVQNTKEFSEFITQDDLDRAMFDDIYRDNITGRLAGGTGTDKDFSHGCRLSPDGRTVLLKEYLPSHNTKVIVTYVPKSSNGDRLSVYKTSDGKVAFRIISSGTESTVHGEIEWTSNSWHRVMCVYRTNSDSDFMTIVIDGEQGGHIRLGRGGSVSETGASSPALLARKRELVNYFIKTRDEYRLISIGSSIYGDKSSRSRMDNIRFSREIRNLKTDSNGSIIDENYSSNLNTVRPVIEDDATSLLINFAGSNEKNNNFATVINPKFGIFNFDINVIDDLNRVVSINDGEIEDLIVSLVNKLKPAHCNALVKFPNKQC